MLNGTIDPQKDYVAGLVPDAAARWPTITVARDHAADILNLIQKSIRDLTTDDLDFVAFGSLARREWTTGSDVDWTLLVDGQASSEHRIAVRAAERAISRLEFKGTQLKEPGAEGIFGSITFSHDIVHHIGGQADTNRNTTQRILLLLEAVPLRDAGDDVGAFDRTVRQVLNRYLVRDSNFHSAADQRSRIPRFLLNDIVRYWRTMCVDFAYKDWEQGGKKWALRNIKLRTSRKFLFVSGLLAVFSCHNNDSLRPKGADRESHLVTLQAHLSQFVRSTPLNIISWTLGCLGLSEPCRKLLDHYEAFLRQLNDPETRERLAKLADTAAYDDPRFLECREISHRMQASLKELFFRSDSPFWEFVTEYGVF